MWLNIYKALMRPATPLLEAYLHNREQRGKEDPARANERRGRPVMPRENKPLVWFHAASVGEAQALLALITRLLKEEPTIQVMVTTGTVTSARLMAERLPPRAFHQYIPVDHPDWVEGFLDHWQPNLVVWSESDFWPAMLDGIKRRNIPSVLLNARMSQKSFLSWYLAPGLIRHMLQTFQLCLGQNEAEVKRLLTLGARDAKVAGNLKYASLPLPYDRSNFDILRGAIGQRPRLLWASTHPGEEEFAFRLHRALKASHPQLLTIIVPRHPVRGGSVAALAEQAGLNCSLRTEGRLPHAADDIYIADTLGELGLFYRLSRLCIMGGSFVPIGGHNPIEPGQLGCAIFYGPHMFNFVTICHDFETRGAAKPLKDEAALTQAMAEALRDPRSIEPMGQAAEAWTRQQAPVVDEITAALLPYVRKAAGAC